jgi:alpha-L-fucosidase 2
MLLQSHSGIIRVFPAIPDEWKDVTFKRLRAEGAFLVSAEMENGVVRRMEIEAEKGGEIKIENPWSGSEITVPADFIIRKNIIEISTKPGQIIKIKPDKKEI